MLRVSTRRGWALAHIAIGAVFSAIQLSAPAADAWSALMGLVGFPWAITSDPTDLLTLPMLAVSYAWVPQLARTRLTASQAGEVAVASAGVVACVATSPGGPIEPFYSSFEADTYIHNANDYDIVLRLRQLDPEVLLDCDLAEEDPAGYLREALFGNAEAWTLAPDATMPVIDEWSRTAAQCHAVWIDADNLAPSVIFWREGQFAYDWIDGTGITPDTRGWISIELDEEGPGRYETEEELVFAIEPLPPIEEHDACTPTGPAQRLAWGTPPSGEWRLGAASEGPDGCVQLDLRTGFEDELEEEGRSWELCLPRGAFPFEEGELLKLRQLGLGTNNDAVEVTALDPNTGEAGTSLIAWVGNANATVFGVQPLVNPSVDCVPVVEETCGTVRQAAQVSLAGGGFDTADLSSDPTVATTTQSETETLDVYLVHASTRLIVAPACGDDNTLGNDIELVAIRRAREGA